MRFRCISIMSYWCDWWVDRCKAGFARNSSRQTDVWHSMTYPQLSPTSPERIRDLLEQAARTRRLAIAISGHPTAPRLEQLAEELDAEIIRRVQGEPEVTQDLLEQAARARRLAITIRGNQVALRLEQRAKELDAEIIRRARLT